MYLVIRASMVFGIFSSKKYMQAAIEQYIKDDYETQGGPCGNYQFKYIKFHADEPWFTRDGKYHKDRSYNHRHTRWTWLWRTS